jgi:hypothetical protein
MRSMVNEIHCFPSVLLYSNCQSLNNLLVIRMNLKKNDICKYGMLPHITKKFLLLLKKNPKKRSQIFILKNKVKYINILTSSSARKTCTHANRADIFQKLLNAWTLNFSVSWRTRTALVLLLTGQLSMFYCWSVKLKFCRPIRLHVCPICLRPIEKHDNSTLTHVDIDVQLKTLKNIFIVLQFLYGTL